jgi:hypothetical protein
MMTERHYLHSMPPAPLACFGVYLRRELVGGVVLTAGARHAHRLLVGADQGTVATVARIWLADDIPKNGESRVLGIVGRTFQCTSAIRALVSYADPAAGHAGTIYQAAGWRYLGLTQPGRYLDFGDGRLHHPRSVYNRYGANGAGHLRWRGIDARTVHIGGKHRYCLILDRTWAWRLCTPALPYPRSRRPIVRSA